MRDNFWSHKCEMRNFLQSHSCDLRNEFERWIWKTVSQTVEKLSLKFISQIMWVAALAYSSQQNYHAELSH